MPTDLPIACSLSATDYGSRLAKMRAVGQSALLTAQTDGRHARLRFRSGPTTQTQLPAIVAAEAECCAFLDMELRADTDITELTIAAPEGAEPLLDELVAAFKGRDSGGASD